MRPLVLPLDFTAAVARAVTWLLLAPLLGQHCTLCASSFYPAAESSFLVTICPRSRADRKWVRLPPYQ